ncbi:MAG: hypothetical protein ACRCVJ_12180 [Clostridium sp.]|uniref:hypothetical protein n=1 Tax=Clostridium sp. TaxID=1506 RepID=UPI003F3D88D2
MFKKYNVKEMKVEGMGLLGGLITINNAIKDTENKIINGGIKGISKEDYQCILEDMQRYKEEFGGDTEFGWTNGENDENFVGYVFIRENKIIDVVEYQ